MIIAGRALMFIIWFIGVLTAPAMGKLPDASSTALHLHKLYLLQPPHDSSLYDILQVSPNATSYQITKSYRRLSRTHHPDKAKNSFQKKRLEEIQQAYEVLNNDATRLPYHQYGLKDPNVAVVLLMGPHLVKHPLDPLSEQLLTLIGYDRQATFTESTDAGLRHEHRVSVLAARLVEQLRPMVEGTADPNLVLHRWMQQCDRWKTLPLGAQIIRCVGRAYRHAALDYLRSNVYKDKTVAVRQQWRQSKHFLSAVLASGRAALTEKVWAEREQFRKKKQKNSNGAPALELHNIDHLSADFLDEDEVEDSESEEARMLESEEEIRVAERLRTQQTLLTSLQVEALWKVAKISIDKVIRQACNKILAGEYFFFPTNQSSYIHHSGLGVNHHSSGWVTSKGRVVHTREAHRRAAEAMLEHGEIMVQRSKVGTSWKE